LLPGDDRICATELFEVWAYRRISGPALSTPTSIDFLVLGQFIGDPFGKLFVRQWPFVSHMGLVVASTDLNSTLKV
jgi:hypothetical protein